MIHGRTRVRGAVQTSPIELAVVGPNGSSRQRAATALPLARIASRATPPLVRRMLWWCGTRHTESPDAHSDSRHFHSHRFCVLRMLGCAQRNSRQLEPARPRRHRVDQRVPLQQLQPELPRRRVLGRMHRRLGRGGLAITDPFQSGVRAGGVAGRGGSRGRGTRPTGAGCGVERASTRRFPSTLPCPTWAFRTPVSCPTPAIRTPAWRPAKPTTPPPMCSSRATN